MIRNGSGTPLNKQHANVPQMGETIRGWFRPITFQRVEKTIVNFEAVETLTAVNGQGMVQPMTPQAINMKPEGERHWKWYTVYCDTSLILLNGEYITYNDQSYRVVGRMNWDEYGYLQYDVVQEPQR